MPKYKVSTQNLDTPPSRGQYSLCRTPFQVHACLAKYGTACLTQTHPTCSMFGDFGPLLAGFRAGQFVALESSAVEARKLEQYHTGAQKTT